MTSREGPRRILIVEDDEQRFRILKWMAKSAEGKGRDPCQFTLVWAKAAGAAIGLLRRDQGSVYAGIMVDHDLTQQSITEQDDLFDGKDVVDAIIAYVDKKTPIFVHSANVTESPKMAQKLEGAGFAVEKISFRNVSPVVFRDWLGYVCECSRKAS